MRQPRHRRCRDTRRLDQVVFRFIVVAALAFAAGCGGSHQASPPPTTTTAGAGASAAGAKTSTPSPGALQAEANAAQAGDIPDNQVFLVFRNAVAGYSMKYPEGWAQQGVANHVTFRDKNNIVRVVVGARPAPTRTSVQMDLTRLKGARPQSPPQRITLSGRPAFKVVYSTESAPNAVTGKRVKLIVDRYYVWKVGRLAIVDLGTPVGVDNVDAYRLMIESLRWN